MSNMYTQSQYLKPLQIKTSPDPWCFDVYSFALFTLCHMY